MLANEKKGITLIALVITIVILLILAVLVSSISQIILKKSASKKYNSIFREYFNVYVILGYGLMVISTILVVLGLKGVQYYQNT